MTVFAKFDEYAIHNIHAHNSLGHSVNAACQFFLYYTKLDLLLE